MRVAATLIIAVFASSAFGALPPPTEVEKAKAAEITAKNDWTAKVSAYQLCLTMDRIAAKYHAQLKASGKVVPALVKTPPCNDPGPYKSPTAVAEPEPLEASEAHSPAGMSVSPPSTQTKEAETKDGQGQ